MTIKSMKDFLARKNGAPCEACGVVHDIEKPCSREALAFRIMALMQANSGIPDLLNQKKEAVQIAKTFQGLLKRADEAHTILMQILSTHGEVGEKIRVQYLMELDSWAQAKEITDPATRDQMELPLSQEPSTLNETETNDCTKQ